ncbi:MAG: peptidylprolyl isomerase [Planctomycetota bacterium]
MTTKSLARALGIIMLTIHGTSLAVAADIVPNFPKKKEPTADAPRGDTEDLWNSVVAEVNGETITRKQLAEELIESHGKEQLELIVNRRLIEQACKSKKIKVTQVDVENEIQKKLKTLNLSRKEYVERVLGPQDITFNQHIRDTIWPAVALKKMVQENVEVTDDDLRKAFEANYGEKVDCRILVVIEQKRAQDLWEEVNKIKGLDERVAKFEDICKTYSIDQATRALGGKAQPINRHTANPEIEKMAFNLKPGELSKIVQVPTGDPQTPSGNLILLCVQRVPPRTDISLEAVANEKTKETVRDLLRQDIHEKKIRAEVTNLYLALRKGARIDNYLTNNFSTATLDETSPDEESVDPTAPPATPSPTANVAPATKGSAPTAKATTSKSPAAKATTQKGN